MYVIAGLGNPTLKYAKTRHNVGFDVIDILAHRYSIRVKKNQFRALTGEGFIGTQKVLLVKPQTYMNNSGESLGPLMEYYKLDPKSQLLLIYDDISLEPGHIRIRSKGSAGGHNGMKNIIAHLGTQDFARVRVGIGDKPQQTDLIDHVLGHFSRTERELVEDAMEHAADAAELILAGQTEEAMNRFNKKAGQSE